MPKRQIMLTVFVHEDLTGYNEDKLYLDHFDWIADTIARISARTMDVTFVPPSDAPFISNLDYKTEDLANLLNTLQDKILEYVESLQPDDYLHKFLLLTRDDINDKTLGVAYAPGIAGVASTTYKVTAAHEIGHMFNANHEDAEESVSTYYGPAKSTMYATADGPIAFRFSKTNEENIRRYLNQAD
ncbi:Metalloendopeptidase [Pseudomonas sp. IT-P74]|uniref:Peptidase M12B domain-containing protein n=1 Tax=Pseudomonas fluorescens TaxID=294 RepID=A0A5E7RZF1_PSEFL|nr:MULTISPECIES: hypothetical protein [Pseudomonas]PBJ24672.1 hypothetical protein BSF44_20470 [Pseudomonas sp. ACN8]VVP79379.1 hypothetical protein PS938_00527 [Pseudomonas fluorescens]